MEQVKNQGSDEIGMIRIILIKLFTNSHESEPKLIWLLNMSLW